MWSRPSPQTADPAGNPTRTTVLCPCRTVGSVLTGSGCFRTHGGRSCQEARGFGRRLIGRCRGGLPPRVRAEALPLGGVQLERPEPRCAGEDERAGRRRAAALAGGRGGGCSGFSFPGWSMGGVVSQAPIRRPAGTGAMTVESGIRAAQSGHRARLEGRPMRFCELTRDLVLLGDGRRREGSMGGPAAASASASTRRW